MPRILKGLPPIASSSCSSSSSTSPSTASSKTQRAWTDSNRECQIAGPQLKPPDLSRHCHSLTGFRGESIPASQHFRASCANFFQTFRSRLYHLVNNIIAWVEMHSTNVYTHIETRTLALYFFLVANFRKQTCAYIFCEFSANAVSVSAEPSCFNKRFNVHLKKRKSPIVSYSGQWTTNYT